MLRKKSGMQKAPKLYSFGYSYRNTILEAVKVSEKEAIGKLA
jgi:hypothetical protein